MLDAQTTKKLQAMGALAMYYVMLEYLQSAERAYVEVGESSAARAVWAARSGIENRKEGVISQALEICSVTPDA